MTMEQFCFCHIDDDSVIAQISQQMLRVTKPGGYILIMDWCVGRNSMRYNGVSKNKIRSLFKDGVETEFVKRFPAQLAPPVGRFLSKHFPSLYQLVASLFPFFVLSHITLLRRMG